MTERDWSQDERDAFYARVMSEETGVVEAVAHAVERTQGKVFGVERESEEWYELEWSYDGTGDWFATTHRYDTLERAKVSCSKAGKHYRVVKKTLITEAHK